MPSAYPLPIKLSKDSGMNHVKIGHAKRVVVVLVVVVVFVVVMWMVVVIVVVVAVGSKSVKRQLGEK